MLSLQLTKKQLYTIIISAAAVLLAGLVAFFIVLYINNSQNVDYTLSISETELYITDKNITPVLTASLTPYSSLAKIEYSSSNTDIITIDKNGSVTAVKSGVAAALVAATINEKTYSAACTVVVDLNEQPEITDPQFTQDVLENSGPPVPEITTPSIDEDGFMTGDNLIEYSMFNPDSVAWLYVAGTSINLPVAQKATFLEREYYLTHGFNYYLKYSGSAFADYRCSLKEKRKVVDQQTVIYGHARGTDIFDKLEKQTILSDWFSVETNRYIYLNTLFENYVFKIFACYHTNFDVAENQTATTTPNFMLSSEQISEKYTQEQISAATAANKLYELQKDDLAAFNYFSSWQSRIEQSDRRYQPFAQGLLARDYEVELAEGDKIITLVTCADSDSNVRYIVQAKLIKTRSAL